MIQTTLPRRALPVLLSLMVGATQLAAQNVVFDRIAGYRLYYIGQKVAALVRVVDNNKRPIPGVPISFRVDDPTIASVSSRGEVISRKAGRTFLWAVTPGDSASVIILVEPRPSKFAFSPSVLRLDALGVRTPLKIQISDAAGNPVPGATTNTSLCRSLNPRIAGYASAGEVVGNANGTTYIRCADRGFADSIRVEVRQVPTKVTITSPTTTAQLTKTVGDTFSVQISATDRAGKVIADARPAWASLTAPQVSVDPLTGRARSLSPGPALIVVQVGDFADTVAVTIKASPFGNFGKDPSTPDTVPTEVKKNAGTTKLQFLNMSISEGVAGSIIVSVQDSAGNTVNNPRLSLRSGDTSIVTVSDSMQVEGRKRGSAWIVATYGTVIDSALFSVGLKATVGASDSTAAAGEIDAPAVLPAWASTDTVKKSVDRFKAQRDSLLQALIASSEYGRPTSGRFFSGAVLISMAAHSSRTDSGKTDFETRSGLLYGGEVTVAPLRRLLLSGSYRTGQLQAATADGGEALTVTEAEAGLAVMLLPELGIRVGYIRRGEKSETATQQWNFPRATLVTRFGFAGDAFNTIADFSLLPKASYSLTEKEGLNDAPSLFSFSGEAGLGYRRGRLNAGLTYYVERFNFELSPRIEQFSALRLRLGFRFGS